MVGQADALPGLMRRCSRDGAAQRGVGTGSAGSGSGIGGLDASLSFK